MALETSLYQPGRRVKIIQQVPRQEGAWSQSVEGVITRYQQAKTGSWFAHAKDDKLWLDRLELRLDDGELTTLNLDQYTRIEILDPPDVEDASDSDEESDEDESESADESNSD
ncbi:MAG: hypothetical protein O7G85_01180 [Planctomycetota bacterium]|nr:hypothetical protein [Planctomycetota bacterium]